MALPSNVVLSVFVRALTLFFPFGTFVRFEPSERYLFFVSWDFEGRNLRSASAPILSGFERERGTESFFLCGGKCCAPPWQISPIFMDLGAPHSFFFFDFFVVGGNLVLALFGALSFFFSVFFFFFSDWIKHCTLPRAGTHFPSVHFPGRGFTIRSCGFQPFFLHAR